MHQNTENPHRNEEEAASWTTVIWTSVTALIGFGFAIFRYIQFAQYDHPLRSVRLTKIELYIYRATGKWGIISVFLLMGFVGLYYAIVNLRELKGNRR